MIPSLSTGQAQGGSILIVDDVDANLKLLANLLTHAGYHVRPAGSAVLALRSVQAQLPDLVLLDVRMPDMDGYELCRRFKADERTRAIPVIFISASVGVEERAEGFEAGAIDFITKPFNEAEVLARVATHLDLYHARQELEGKNARLLAEAAERGRAEQALVISNASLVEAQAMGHIGSWSMDLTTRAFVWSDELYFIHGLEPGTPVSHEAYLELVHPDDRPHVLESMRSGMAGKQQAFVVDYRVIRPDGSQRFVALTGKTVADSSGTATALRGTIQDITDRRRAEQKLRESENRFRAVFDQAAVGVALLNTKTGQFVQINQRYCDFLGYTRREMLQKTFADVTFPEDIQQNIDGVARLIKGDSSEFSYEKRYVRKDGSLVWGSLAISPLWKPGEKPTTYFHIAVVEDITDRKRAEAKREAVQEQLLQSKKLEAVGQLAGGVAHNFNNLLTGILGYIDIAQSDLGPLHPAATSLDTARKAALQAASLAKRLLSVGRNAMLAPTPQNAAAAVQSAWDLVGSSLPSSIEVVQDLSTDTWDVMVDSPQLTHVLLELADNAREAMDDEGTITIRVGNVTVDDAFAATAPFARIGDFVVVSVADTGPGIDPAILPRLFEPFATTKTFGRGLGLPMVFGALQQAGGWATACSNPGGGTRIDLYLPRYMGESFPST